MNKLEEVFLQVNEILTVPKEEVRQKYMATGNEYVSLPSIVEGNIESVNALLKSTNSLLDFRGRIAPYVVNESGQALVLTSQYYENSWIPVTEYSSGDLRMKSKIICPPGHKGFCILLEMTNTGNQASLLECGVGGEWESSFSTVFQEQKICAQRNIFLHQWTNSVIFDLKSGTSMLCMAAAADGAAESELAETSFLLKQKLEIDAGQTVCRGYYFSLNLEMDGAGTTNIDLRRRGATALYRQQKAWLTQRRINTQDAYLDEITNRNLLFCYFYSAGYTIDTQELVLLTSRSPKYYVSTAFWGRDSLLWAFPGIYQLDKAKARELLLVCFTTYMQNAGIHALYINGTVLYPGFELDQAAAYLVALGEYIEWSADFSILKNEAIRLGTERLLELLESWKDAETGLYRTELNPSDDPVGCIFLTYNNVLVWKGLRYMERLGYPVDKQAQRLQESIIRHLVIEKEGKKMFAWAGDGQGGSELYDDPPGSLILLKYYGFCDKDDEIYKNTMDWVFSTRNVYYYNVNGFRGTGCIHSPSIWPMSLCNQLLSGELDSVEALAMFRQMPMDNGFACETVSELDGGLKTGGAFATFAGFLGYTLAKIFAETVG